VAGAAVLALGCLSLLAQSRQPAARGTARPAAAAAAEGRPIKVLFVGTNEDTPHNPSKMFPLLAAPLARRGIQLTYGRSPAEVLNSTKLSYYDAVMIYGDQLALTAAQQTLLNSFVDEGHGVVALHAVGELPLVGATLQPQGGGEFTAAIVQPANPVVQGLEPFTTWEESLASAPAAAGRTVVMERVDAQGRQPWTWLKTQGKGRVFYTAYGHDERTWSNPGFQNLVERGIVWSVAEARRRTWQQLEMPGITYVDGFNVPNYENRPDPPKFQLPFPPDQAEKFIQTPAEFRLELFASEPDIIKPITFTFDERGRLWVVEAMDYPNEVLNGNPGDDRIKILEDTNGDGRADKFTVFAEHLNIPTSLTFANGGVIVAAAPHFLFLKDTNGDDKADVRQILNTGWGIRDSHAGP
jgi:type 1 glutamine amidotransferase